MKLRRFPVIALSALFLLPGGAFGNSNSDPAVLEAKLAARRNVIEKDRKALNAECGAVSTADAAKVAECRRRRDDVARRINEYKIDYKHLQELWAGPSDLYYSIPQDEVRIPTGIKLLAKKLKWSTEKQARLDKALKDIGFDGLDPITEDNVRDGWRAIQGTADNADLSRAADAASGPRLSAVGQRTKMDCTISAMATATGQPYDNVAARAKDLIRQGEWRNPYVRENPQEAIDKGLTGGEVVMLAESLGRAEVAPSSRFEEILKGGRPVLVNVATISSKQGFLAGTTTAFGSHQVVLTKTFQNNGKTWYEVADSNSPGTRYFVTPEKLNLILQEKGVAFGRP